MKKVKKSKVSKYEPTITDVLQAVETGFAKVEERFGGVEGRIGELEVSLGRHENLLVSLVEGQDQLRVGVNILDQRLTKTQNRVEDIADLLESTTEVTDKNKVSLLDHERRIRHLERTRA